MSKKMSTVLMLLLVIAFSCKKTGLNDGPSVNAKTPQAVNSTTLVSDLKADQLNILNQLEAQVKSFKTKEEKEAYLNAVEMASRNKNREDFAKLLGFGSLEKYQSRMQSVHEKISTLTRLYGVRSAVPMGTIAYHKSGVLTQSKTNTSVISDSTLPNANIADLMSQFDFPGPYDPSLTCIDGCYAAYDYRISIALSIYNLRMDNCNISLELCNDDPFFHAGADCKAAFADCKSEADAEYLVFELKAITFRDNCLRACEMHP